MSVHSSDSAVEEAGQLRDFLARIEAERPEVRFTREDLRGLHELIDELVSERTTLKLSQTDLANKMGVKQPTVSQFENESSDPKVSTLQRYARAVGRRLAFQLLDPSEDATGPSSSGCSECRGTERWSGSLIASTPYVRHDARPDLAWVVDTVVTVGQAKSMHAAAADYSRSDLALSA